MWWQIDGADYNILSLEVSEIIFCSNLTNQADKDILFPFHDALGIRQINELKDLFLMVWNWIPSAKDRETLVLDKHMFWQLLPPRTVSFYASVLVKNTGISYSLMTSSTNRSRHTSINWCFPHQSALDSQSSTYEILSKPLCTIVLPDQTSVSDLFYDSIHFSASFSITLFFIKF